MKVGVLALQGAFDAHCKKLRQLDVNTVEVRRQSDFEGVDALVMPGGESTTMSMLLESSGLFEDISERISHGMPVFGTCAGLILLATNIADGRPDQRSFARIDMSVKRNGYGRQVESFEGEISNTIFEDPLHAVFIRAPLVTSVGPDVEVLAVDRNGAPALVRDGSALAASFHPEITQDTRIHELFLESFVDNT